MRQPINKLTLIFVVSVFLANLNAQDAQRHTDNAGVRKSWIENHGMFFLQKRDILIRGPYVVRQLYRPTFIFPTLELKDPRIETSAPFIIVLNEPNAFRALTSIKTRNPSIFSWSASGKLMGDKISDVSFCYEFDWFGWEKGLDGLEEIFEIQADGNVMPIDESFDLKRGRVFELSVDGEGQVIIAQRDVALPTARQMLDFEGTGDFVDTDYRTNVIIDWWSPNSNADKRNK